MSIRGASVAITDDLFGIADRAKSIDPRYRIEYNKGKRRFEVFVGEDRSCPIVLPFNRLDCRALTYLRKTRIERLAALQAEIDRHNALEEQRRLSELRSKALDALDGIL